MKHCQDRTSISGNHQKGLNFFRGLISFICVIPHSCLLQKSSVELSLVVPTFPGKNRGQHLSHLFSTFCKQQDNAPLKDCMVGLMISKNFSNAYVEPFLFLLDVHTIKDEIF